MFDNSRNPSSDSMTENINSRSDNVAGTLLLIAVSPSSFASDDSSHQFNAKNSQKNTQINSQWVKTRIFDEAIGQMSKQNQ